MLYIFLFITNKVEHEVGHMNFSIKIHKEVNELITESLSGKKTKPYKLGVSFIRKSSLFIPAASINQLITASYHHILSLSSYPIDRSTQLE